MSATGPVVRTRLLEVLDTVEPGGVLTIVAPAGCGKSTLLTQWVQRNPSSRRVVSLRDVQDDVDVLGGRVVGAIAGIAASARRWSGRAEAASPDWRGDLIPRLIAVLGEQPLGLALDDVHLVSSPACLSFLSALVRGLPAPSTLVLSGRRRPVVPVRRTPGAQVRTLREEDLVFDADELEELVAGDRSRLRKVRDRTGGWPAGVRLEGLLRDDVDAEAAGTGPRAVAEYLDSEVFSQFSADELELLAHVAFLSPVEATLADEILNRDDTVQILRGLQERGLPMVRISEPPDEVITFHPQLSEPLVERWRSRDPETVGMTLERACSVAFDSQRHDFAFALAERGGDRAALRTMCFLHAAPLVLNGQRALLRSWLGRFTEQEIAADPGLALAFAPTIRPRAEHAVRDLVDPFADVDEPLLPDGTSPAVSARALVVSLGLSPCEPRDLEAAGRLRVAVLARHAWQLYAADRLEEAQELLLHLDGSGPGFPVTRAIHSARLALLALELGDPDEAADRVGRARESMEFGRLGDLDGTFMVDVALMQLARHRGDRLEAAETSSRVRSKMARLADGPKLDRITALLACAELDLGLGRLSGAAEMHRQARELRSTWGPVPRLDRRADELARRLAEAPTRSGPGRDEEALSDAELRVLHFLPSHFTLPEVAAQLYVSTNTVRTHRAAIYRKLRVRSRSEAVRVAGELGLLGGDGGAVSNPP